MKTYKYEIGGSSWMQGPVTDIRARSDAGAIRQAKRLIGQDTGDWAKLTDGDRVVARWRRDPDGDGRGWYLCG